jgi:phosphonate transport system substrate-binding protein
VIAPRSAFRFGLPSALPVAPAPGATARLTRVLSGIVGREVSVVQLPDYDALTDAVRRGDVDAAWAPPLVAARAEALGARILARPLRRGSVRSRSALLVRADSPLQLETLAGTTAAWVDRASLAGHLLPMAWLRERGLEAAKLFGQQLFLGSYQACLEALLEGEADVAALFAPPEGHDLRLAVEEVAPGRAADVRVLAWRRRSRCRTRSASSAGYSPCARFPRGRRSCATCSAPTGSSGLRSSAIASSSAVASPM